MRKVALWQDIVAQVENMTLKVHHIDAHMPKSHATEEHQNNEQVDKAAKIGIDQVDLEWKGVVVKGAIWGVIEWMGQRDLASSQGQPTTTAQEGGGVTIPGGVQETNGHGT
ncbi:hypothetical protein BTVI_145476 [Pitangus sulphuratus]|nr:hypothetical protein BTVI_145476 [Pitangus sulphuratus]